MPCLLNYYTNSMRILTTTFVWLTLFSSSALAESIGTTSSEQADPSLATELPLEQIKNFAQIFTRIKRYYVEPVSDEELLDYAIRGMLNGLDPHSIYLKGDKYDDVTTTTSGEFSGLGIEVVMDKGYVKVVTPVDGSPAAKAGVLTGDLIVKINGESLAGLSLSESTAKMRGEPNTAISLTILRDGVTEPIELELVRAIIRQPSVRRARLSDSIGYIRISQFQLSTAEQFRRELNKIKKIIEI